MIILFEMSEGGSAEGSLADGGVEVGIFAKSYFCEGVGEEPFAEIEEDSVFHFILGGEFVLHELLHDEG
jgi:hypothetical protein